MVGCLGVTCIFSSVRIVLTNLGTDRESSTISTTDTEKTSEEPPVSSHVLIPYTTPGPVVVSTPVKDVGGSTAVKEHPLDSCHL